MLKEDKEDKSNGLDQLMDGETSLFEMTDRYGDGLVLSRTVSGQYWMQTANGATVVLSRKDIKRLRKTIKREMERSAP